MRVEVRESEGGGGGERETDREREEKEERKRKKCQKTVLRFQHIYRLKDSDGHTLSNQEQVPSKPKLQSTSPVKCNIQTEMLWPIIGSAQLKWKAC